MNISIMKNIVLLLCFLMSAQSNAGEHVTYYVNDALGSPIMALNQAGDVAWQESYQPYGQRQIKSSAANSDEQFYTGKQEEPDIGLQYYGARWYDPDTGRFTSIDPVGVQEGNIHSFNRYAYANNNPYKYVDPDGRDAVGIVYEGYMVDTGFWGIKMPLGHAGVLLIDNNSGLTKYYEYGRYDPAMNGVIGAGISKLEGNIRNEKVPDVVIGEDGKATQESLNKVYAHLSKKAGKSKPVEAEYIKGADFKKMKSYVDTLSNNKEREKYSLPDNTCYTFKDKVISSGKN